MKPIILATLGLSALALVLTACEPVVFDLVVEGSGGGSAASATSVTSSASGGEGSPQALAFRGAEAPVGGDLPAGSAPIGDPESLVLYFGNTSFTCEAPLMSSACDGTMKWQFVLSIPPELDREGLIYLDDPRIGFSEVITLDSCGGGGGSGNGFWGTLEILALDATSVSVRLTGTTATSELAFDGDYVATRCGSVPAPAPPTPAIALGGSDVVGNPSSGTGPTADPAALYLYAGSVPGTCEEPAPIVDCGTERQLVLSLPPELQVPGVVALDAPEIDAIYSGPGTSCGPATFDGGTLEISLIDEEAVEFRVLGSGYAGFDGLYRAARCP